MTDSLLGRLEIKRLAGTEPFHLNDSPTGFDVQDFWAWYLSDLVSNTTRGIVAEYIVAKALGLPTDQAREEWGAFDLKTNDGLRIEVKSSAYIQSWAQTKLSTIQFVVSKRLGWDPDTNIIEQQPRRHADVYVFALLANQDQETIDPRNLSQWQFWAVPTQELDDRARSQHSITLNSLRNLAGEPVDFGSLAGIVREAAVRQKEGIACSIEP